MTLRMTEIVTSRPVLEMVMVTQFLLMRWEPLMLRLNDGEKIKLTSIWLL